jgi:adenosylhomocysteine nucleosidase
MTALLSAMPEEVGEVLELMEDRKSFDIGMRHYQEGRINGQQVVAVFSRWGKVAAATTVTTLIQKFGISKLIFTGVAAAIDERLAIGDVVIADKLLQHDMDASPMMPRFEIPLLQKTWFKTDGQLLTDAKRSVDSLLEEKNYHQHFDEAVCASFGITQPKCWTGAIASGDQFIASNAQREKLKELLPEVLCVEMEGAAVAQVCYEHSIPFIIIRTISDVAGDQSHIDFPAFVAKVAGRYSREIVRGMLG